MQTQTLAETLKNNPNPKIELIEKKISSPFFWSPSQVDNFTDCERKWFFDKILKKPRPENAAAAFGTEVHDLRETYLKIGELPKGDSRAAKTARAGIESLPLPQFFTDDDIEKSFRFKLGRTFVSGKIDFYLADQGASGYNPAYGGMSKEGVPLVGDHKTTGKREYIKDTNYLQFHDAQSAIYGYVALQETPEAECVDFHWAYMIKGTRPQGVDVMLRSNRDHVESRFKEICVTKVKKMLSIFDSGVKDPKEIKPSLESCDKYGGCPYREFCPQTNEQKIGAISMPAGALEALLNKNKNGVTPAPDNSMDGMMGGMEDEKGPELQNEQLATSGLGALQNALAGETKTKTFAEKIASSSKAEEPAPKQAVGATGPSTGVVPPDAQAADLDAEPPKKKAKVKAAKEKTRLDGFVLELAKGAGPNFMEGGQDAIDLVMTFSKSLIAAIDAE